MKEELEYEKSKGECYFQPNTHKKKVVEGDLRFKTGGRRKPPKNRTEASLEKFVKRIKNSNKVS
jgi:hypothetical protein